MIDYGTVKEILARYAGQYEDYEIVVDFNSNRLGFHTDQINFTENYNDESLVIEYELMSQEDYNDSVMANCSYKADFNELYGNSEVKILVIKIKEEVKKDYE